MLRVFLTRKNISKGVIVIGAYKKVLILSHCFYPSKNRGGPVVSVTNLVKSLSEKLDISVITTIFEKNTHEPYSNVSVGENSIFNSKVYYIEKEDLFSILKLISDIKPDTIYVSSFFSMTFTLPALIYCKRYKNVRLIIAPRGEIMKTSLRRHSLKKFLFINFVKFFGLLKRAVFHVTSNQEAEDLKSVFGNKKTFLIKNISLADNCDISKRNKKRGSLNILTVGRVHPIKNISYAINVLKKLNGDVTFDIYGPKEDVEYYEYCMSLCKDVAENIKVSYKGSIEHDELAQIYPKYHLFFSPTQTENYGHSIVEAMRYRCPVVISNNTPWNAVNNNGGFAIALEDDNLFVEALQKFVDMDETEYNNCCEQVYKFINDNTKTEDEIAKYYDMLTLGE